MLTKQLIPSLLLSTLLLSNCHKNDDPVHTNCQVAGQSVQATSTATVRSNSLLLAFRHLDPNGLTNFDATFSRVPLTVGQHVVSDSIAGAATALLIYPGCDFVDDDFVALHQGTQYVEITSIDHERQHVKGAIRVTLVLSDLHPPKATTLPDTLVFECRAFDLRWDEH